MSDPNLHPPASDQPQVRRHRHLSFIWAVPIVALLVAGWLGWSTYSKQGPTITIRFQSAAGLEAGKTRVKHRDIELGVVQSIEPTPDLSQVIVTVKMNKVAADHLGKASRFWVVRPRFSLSGVSGLDTLVSGAYIEMEPSEGREVRSFVGLEEPPIVLGNEAGTEFIVETGKLGPIGVGSPVFFRDLKAGRVTQIEFVGIEHNIAVHLFVKEPFDKLVHPRTLFWNASGINLSTGAGGFKVDVESLEAVLSGGVAFETPEEARSGAPSEKDSVFPLYDSRAEAQEAIYSTVDHDRAVIQFEGSVRGLRKGSPVELRGITIGQVVDIRLELDPAKKVTQAPVLIEFDLSRIRVRSGQPKIENSAKLLDTLVAIGMRAQLQTVSLVTGQLAISFDFFPDAKPATVDRSGRYPIIPSVPSALTNITNSVSAVLDKVNALPIDKTLDDIRHLLVSLQEGYGRDSDMNRDVAELLRQLQETAKSVRQLADYLEQHPESVVRGK